MKLSLLVSSGVNEGELLQVDRVRLLIGRGPHCHVRPNSPEVSLQHCGFFVRGQDAFLRDLDSKTGTFLNGRRLRGEIELRDGDLIQVGPLNLSVILENDSARAGTGAFRATGRAVPTVIEKNLPQATDDLPPGWQPATVDEAAAPPLESGETLIHHAPETQEMPAYVPSEEEDPEDLVPLAENTPAVSAPPVAPAAAPESRGKLRKTTQLAGGNGRRTQLAPGSAARSRAPT